MNKLMSKLKGFKKQKKNKSTSDMKKKCEMKKIRIYMLKWANHLICMNEY